MPAEAQRKVVTADSLQLSLSIIATMLLPALGKANTKAQGIICMDNPKQMQLGWVLYSGDNAEKIVPMGGLEVLVTYPNDPAGLPGGENQQWVLGTVDRRPSATNENLKRTD